MEQTKPEWEKRFDEKFDNEEFPFKDQGILPSIKDFIRTEIELAEKRGYDNRDMDWEKDYAEGHSAGRASILEEIKQKIRKDRKFFEDEDHAVGGYISVKDLDDFLSTLTPKE